MDLYIISGGGGGGLLKDTRISRSAWSIGPLQLVQQGWGKAPLWKYLINK